MKRTHKTGLTLFLLLSASICCLAQIRLPQLVGEGMIMQRDAPLQEDCLSIQKLCFIFADKFKPSL
jgi:hypothetical protein